MKKQKKIILALMLVIVTALSGCGKDFNLVVGSWNGNVFENTWLNMKIEIQEDWKISSNDEISEILGVDGEKLSALQGTDKEAKKAAAKLKTIYGFIVSAPVGTMNAQLIYDNLELSKGNTKYTEEEYLDTISESLLNIDSAGYEVKEESTKELAGKTFYCLKMSGNDGAINQDYYCYKMDNYMVTLMFIYSPEEENLKDELINNISVIEEK